MSVVRIFLAALLLSSILPAAPPAWGQPVKKPMVRPAAQPIPPAPRIVAPMDGLTTKQGTKVDVLVVAPNEENVSSVVVLGDDGGALGISSQSPFVIHYRHVYGDFDPGGRVAGHAFAHHLKRYQTPCPAGPHF